MDGNVGMAEGVIDDFAMIDSYDHDIEDAIIRIMTIYQPTVRDTKTVVTI